jgi:PAS domain S-box-containing protein
MVPRHRCADSRTPGRFVLPLLAVALVLLLPASADALEGAAPTNPLELAGNWKSHIGDAPGWAGLVVGGVAVLVILLGAVLLFRFNPPLNRQLKESEGEARAVVPRGSRYYREGNTRLVALSILLAVGVFALDLSLPLGVAGGVPYVALVLVSLWFPQRKYTLVAAAAGSILTLLGFALSPSGGVLWMVIFNRGLALSVIWVTAILGLQLKGAVGELREAGTRYRTIFEQSPDAILIVDPKTTLPLEFNDKMHHLLGYSRAEFAQLRISDYEALESPEQTRAHIEKVLREGGDEFETQLRTQQGKIINALVKTRTIDIAGRVALHNIVRDITEHKRAEEAVRRSEASLANAQRIARLGSWDWDVVSNESYWSDEMHRIFGTHPQSFEVNYEAFLSTVHPDDRERVKKAVSESLYEGKPYNIEYRIVLPDGAEHIGHSQGEVSFDQAGKPIRMAGTVLDITERKRAEETLHATRERLRYLVSSSPAVFYSSKPSGDYGATFISENVAKQTGYEARDFIEDSKFWADHIHPEDAPLVFAELPRVFERGEHIHEYRFLHKDGSYRWMRDELKLVRDSAGNPLEIIGCWTDITERKQAEEQIKASLREKEVLLQEVHHRVKNNLQVISSLLNLQASRIKDRHARELFTESQSRVRAIALMHETLYQSKDLSRIDFGEYSRTLAANLFASYGVDPEVVSWRINVENGFLGVDAAIPCGLIVSELISNSLKYAFPAGQHGEICIDFRRDDRNQCILVVKDNGIGLPKEFDLRKLESLGLQLVCTLTDQLDGSLELDCTEGTEFRITFAARRTTERGTDNGQRTNPGS